MQRDLLSGRDNSSIACQVYKYLEITRSRKDISFFALRNESYISNLIVSSLYYILSLKFCDLKFRLYNFDLYIDFLLLCCILCEHKIPKQTPFRWLTARTSFQTLEFFFQSHGLSLEIKSICFSSFICFPWPNVA